MHLDILVRAGTGVAEDGAVDGHVAGRPPPAPRLDDPQGPRGHAVDGPLGVAVGVADGDREAAVVGPDDVEPQPGGAGDVQPGVFAGVGRAVLFGRHLVVF